MNNINKNRNQTIKDFGNQWEQNKVKIEFEDDFWLSDEIVLGHFDKIFNINNVKGKKVCDVGAGIGRFVKALIKFKAEKIFAVEPSNGGIGKLNSNFKNYSNQVEIIQSDGATFKLSEKCDFTFILGVLHHIKNPKDVLENVYANLNKDGKVIIWVYGYENNMPYIIFYNLVSKITKFLPDFLLWPLCSFLNIMLIPYIFLCKFIDLPLKKYLLNIFSKCGWKSRNLIIFDQLNPRYAKYYKKDEIIEEITRAGFKLDSIHHRDSYSWSIVGKK